MHEKYIFSENMTWESGMRRTQNKVPWTISMDWKDPMGISNSNGNPNNNYTVL